MNPSSLWLVPILGAVTSSSLATLALKGALLLAAGAATSRLLHKQSAAVRHFVWVLAIGGTLALAVVAPVAPHIALPLPLAAQLAPEALHVASSTPVSAGEQAIIRLPSEAMSASAGRSGTATGRSANRWPAAVRWNATTVWLAGCAAVLLWSLIGHIGLARTARAATPMEEGSAWSSMLRSARLANGVERTVRLARSEAIGAPVTWGWLHPTILMPADADSWPVERRHVALQHELAHVARGDYLTQLVATIACAMQWFNPLVWLAARRLRTESEHACDDLVLMKGTPAADYASHLLEVARGSWNFRLGGFVAVSMARPSHLEGRLLALLDEARARKAPRTRSRLMAVTMAAVVVVPFAGVRPASDVATPPGSVRSELDLVPAGLTKRLDGAMQLVQPDAVPSLRSPAGLPVTAGSSGTVSSPLDSMFERRVEASSGGTLVLDLDTGASVRIRGGDDHEVVLRAHLAGEDWRDSRVELERDGNDVRLTSRYVGRSGSHSSSNAFEIRVPRRYDVRVNSSGGDINIADVEGSFSGQTGGGGLVLEHLTGRASLSTGGGDIEVTDSDLQGRVSTGGGVVRLSRVRGGLRGSSGSGPVIYVEDEVTRPRRDADRDSSGDPIYIIDGVPVTGERARERSDEARRGRSRERSADAGRGEGSGRGRSADAGDLADVRIRESGSRIENGGSVRGSLSITKSGGDINLDDAPFGATVHTGGGRVRITKGAGVIEASTGGGNIDIGPIAGSVSAGTGAGDVHITLIKANGVRQEIDVTSGSGGVEIELPANIDARFELESAFTENFRRQTRIESDFELEKEVTRDWDDSQGTPRRYVRARGTVGNGRGLISVRTVNGDVVVRRTR